MRELLFIALIVACPLMMLMMMRGGHGHGGHGGHGTEVAAHETSTDDLRRQRAELDRLIDERDGSTQGESDRKSASWGRG